MIGQKQEDKLIIAIEYSLTNVLEDSHVKFSNAKKDLTKY